MPRKGKVPPQLKAHLFKKGTKHGKAHPNAKKTGKMNAGLKKFLAARGKRKGK